MSTTDTLTEEDRAELELAEQARVTSGSWDSVAPGKAANFGASFRRLIGLLRPYAWAFGLVSLAGALGVVLAVLAPKVLGEATNIIFEESSRRASPSSSPRAPRRRRSSRPYARRARTTSPTSSGR